MARRSKRTLSPTTYRQVFSFYPAMRERLTHILEEGVDPAPGLTSCRNLELTITALAEGKPAPLNVGELNGAVEHALRGLFAARDERAVS